MQIHVTLETFLKCIKEIKGLSDKFHDGWLLLGECDTQANSAYLTKTIYHNLILCETESQLVTFEYNVVYNISYSTPILCFNAWHTNGSLLTLEECWKVLNINKECDALNILTQMEHPILFRPFYMLHPCKTPELLGKTSKTSKNPIVSWLSSIGPCIKLDVNLNYASLTV